MKKMRRIAIHSVPRSGSTWLATIFDSSEHCALRFQPLFSYSHKGQLSPNSSSSEIEEYFSAILRTNDEFVLQTSKDRKALVPDFRKEEITHLIYKEVRYHYVLKNLLLKDTGLMVIGMIRNPLATLWSWRQAPREFRSDLGWKMEEEWRFAPKKNRNRPEEYNGYEKWKEVAYLFHELRGSFGDRFIILPYVELLSSTEKTITKIFTRCDLKITKQTLNFIEESKNTRVEDPYGVYKIRDNDNLWMGNMSDNIVHFIHKDLKGTVLERYLA